VFLTGVSVQLEMVSVLIGVLGCLAAAITDYKWGIVPDKLNYVLIATGALLVFLRFDLSGMLLVYGVAAAIFLLGLLAYTFGQFGGGDVKLFTAFVLLIPWYPSFLFKINPLKPVVAPYPFLISVFFVAAVIAVFFVSLQYIVKIVRDMAEIKDFKSNALKGVMLCLLFLPLFAIWLYLKPVMMLIIVPLVFGSFLIPFKRTLLEKYITIKKKVKDLNDDDVIAIELLDDEVKEKLGLSSRKTFFNVELDKIKEAAKKNRIKEIVVSEYLPKFVPYVFVSLLINLAFGDAFLWMLAL